MSRIGKLPVVIPAGVTITVDDDFITVKGPKGELKQFTLPEVKVKVDGSEVQLTAIDNSKIANSRHGLMRALIQNMVIGVSQGFAKKLEINGVGFRLQSKGPQEIEMALGFSHPVDYKAPDGVNLDVDTKGHMWITVSGASKQQVGQVAAEIRALKAPEPYKGKGIKYADETILRKAGKTGK
ncbi:MAG: 50S ribosomal protein L6 [Candidatus Nanoperiomorbaceae bacterium]